MPAAELTVGALVFDGVDQLDLTAPYEVLARIPGASVRLYGLADAPVRDVSGLRLTPDAALEDAPPLDVLHVPGGFGQEELMQDERVLGWLRAQAGQAAGVLSVCTGALLLGAAGLLGGRRATTHWSAHHLLADFGAIPVDARVVADDDGWVFAAGVTAGIDGALRLVAGLRGQAVAETIQLTIAYHPEPPFDSGTPDRAPAAVLDDARAAASEITARRERTARAYAARRSTR